MRGLRKSRTRSIAVGVGLLAVVLTITSCTGKDEKKADPTTSASSGQSSGGEQRTAADLSSALYAQNSGTVLGTSTGNLPNLDNVVPMKVEVLEVWAGPSTTLVRYRMTYLGDEVGFIPTGPYVSSRDRNMSPNDVRETEIVVPQENMRLDPYVAVKDKDESEGDHCLCTDGFIGSFSAADPILLSGSFPALSPGIKTINLDVPGFPVIENLPVTRG